MSLISYPFAFDEFGFGSTEHLQVLNAWDAVGNYDPGTSPANLVVAGTIGAEEIVFSAAQTLYLGAAGPTPVFIPSGHNVIARGGEGIEIRSGFEIELGATLIVDPICH